MSKPEIEKWLLHKAYRIGRSLVGRICNGLFNINLLVKVINVVDKSRIMTLFELCCLRKTLTFEL